jgi:Uma2 family endonuclease
VVGRDDEAAARALAEVTAGPEYSAWREDIMAAIATPVHHFTVDEFLALHATDPVRWERTELVNGEIWDSMPETEDHAALVEAIHTALRARCQPLNLLVRSHGSVQLAGDGMPMPDVFIVRKGEKPEGGYWNGTQLALAVEVSFTTQSYDLNAKATAYARGGVPHYFVVLAQDDEPSIVQHFQDPHDGRYRSMVEGSLEDIFTDALS